MEGILAILFLSLVLSFIWNAISEDTDKVISCLCTIITSVLFTIILIDYISKDEPTPLDVYRGNTTIEITYRDSVPIDSTVVFG